MRKGILLAILFCLLVLSCNRKSSTPVLDIGKIEKIEIVNKGYNENTQINNSVTITDIKIIEEILNTLHYAKPLGEDVTIGSNYGYIRSTFFNDKGVKVTFKNFYSVYDGVIILFEDDQGIRRYGNKEFVFKIEEQLFNGVAVDQLLDKVSDDNP